jgi:hypothetical protein
MQETHEGTNIITEHPVEDGADIADHVRPQLRRFSVEGYVSDTPLLSNAGVVDQATFRGIELQIPEKPFKLGVSNALNAGISAIGNAISPTPAVKVLMLTFDSFKSRKRAARDILEDARTNARLVRVITSLTEYENMIIEQIVITRSPDDGTGATFNVSLKEIERVSSDITVAPEPAEVSGAIKVAAGSKNAKDDAAKIDTVKKSVLAGILDKGVGFFESGFGAP